MLLAAPGSYSEDLTPTHGGDPFRIFVYAPDGPAPAAGWPLLCLTDGNAVFGTAVDALRGQATWPSGTDVGEGVIAAIGYPTPAAYDPLRRSWDLTPAPGRAYPPFTAGGLPARTGGAAPFLRFLASDLLPWIQNQTSIDQRRTSLFGHSFGGLFALYSLFTRPELFRNIFAASPSLSWEDGSLRPAEDAFFAGTAECRDIRVHLSAGAYEGEQIAPFYHGRADEAERRAHQRQIATISLARALSDRIAAAGVQGLTCSFELFAGENHMSVPTVAVSRAVQTAFSLSWDRRSKHEPHS
ncbi:alpha/beta hydrolase-fold protein [Lichenihabitans sp. Uapishka_5]|uniref:alpha/beta hydrolase n=1 Tax=Lichenihabitans sp. Uapishka_5 TaxID=3037302 RepID=UPI0029E7E5EF|nr:alpha/beta hydrolase-fold protein [Lichenihabitans sp. Uapishka_5]MDX7953653.1 alpha/beta hydrolase-fold protein [Lichenihabitans sp. Uapishka_5]